MLPGWSVCLPTLKWALPSVGYSVGEARRSSRPAHLGGDDVLAVELEFYGEGPHAATVIDHVPKDAVSQAALGLVEGDEANGVPRPGCRRDLDGAPCRTWGRSGPLGKSRRSSSSPPRDKRGGEKNCEHGRKKAARTNKVGDEAAFVHVGLRDGGRGEATGSVTAILTPAMASVSQGRAKGQEHVHFSWRAHQIVA